MYVLSKIFLVKFSIILIAEKNLCILHGQVFVMLCSVFGVVDCLRQWNVEHTCISHRVLLTRVQYSVLANTVIVWIAAHSTYNILS